MAAEIAASSPDFVAIATNVGVGIGFVAAAITAIWRAVKKLKEAMPASNPTTSKVVGGMIMDHTTLLMWSESNKDVVEAMKDHEREMRELRYALTSLKDKIK